MDTLEKRLRAIAASACDWNAPITAKQDCLDAVAEIKRLRATVDTCRQILERPNMLGPDVLLSTAGKRDRERLLNLLWPSRATDSKPEETVNEWDHNEWDHLVESLASMAINAEVTDDSGRTVSVHVAVREELAPVIAEIERLRGERPTCEWSRDGEVYDTGCGECFAFTDSGDLAEQPSIQWCPFCSGLIREAAEAAGGENDD